MSSAIEIRNLTKRYNDLTILNDISFSIEPSEFIVFLGPSGCGKSTLLRMIAGLESISDGEIWMDQNRLDVLPPGKRNVSMVFQNYALYPHMTVEDNMAFGLKNIGTDPDQISRRNAGNDPFAETQTRRAFRRSAAACGDRAGDCQRAEGVPV